MQSVRTNPLRLVSFCLFAVCVLTALVVPIVLQLGPTIKGRLLLFGWTALFIALCAIHYRLSARQTNQGPRN